MSPRSSVVPIVVSSVAAVTRLFVATLTVTAAYAGTLTTMSPGRAGVSAATTASTTGAFADSAPAPGTAGRARTLVTRAAPSWRR